MTKPFSVIHFRKKQDNGKRGWTTNYMDRDCVIYEYDTVNHLWWVMINKAPVKWLYAKVVNALLRPFWPLHERYVNSDWPYRLKKAWLFMTFRYAPYYVNVYEVDRAYGGPEEGGWWYDCGTPYSVAFGKSTFKFLTRERAQAFADKLRQQLEQPETFIEDSRGWGFGKYVPHIDRSSVIGGPDIEVHVEKLPAHEFPSQRPYYC